MKKYKNKKRLIFSRGHAWGQGRPTQTHSDRRTKRLKTRKNKLIKSLEEQEF
jgi:hypothetical protein